jgi:shikimate dehydrogenase
VRDAARSAAAATTSGGELLPGPAALAVLGHPVGHSLSPAMHNAAFAALGRPAAYHAFDVPPERLADALRGLAALGFLGANLTVPHKERAVPLMDELDPAAAALGAVNTVAVRDGRLVGSNTDGAAFLRALLEEVGWRPAGRSAVVIGAGGAARAVVAALRAGGASVAVLNRTPERARALSASGGGLASAGAFLPGADLLVNCTTLGMHPHVDAAPPVDLGLLPAGALVADIVYNPRQTRLLREARARGLRVVGGLGMLAWQGALAWRPWFGEVGPADVMRRAAEEALGA